MKTEQQLLTAHPKPAGFQPPLPFSSLDPQRRCVVVALNPILETRVPRLREVPCPRSYCQGAGELGSPVTADVRLSPEFGASLLREPPSGRAGTVGGGGWASGPGVQGLSILDSQMSEIGISHDRCAHTVFGLIPQTTP